MKAIACLLALLAIVRADYVHDLDDQDHLDLISENGINMNKQNKKVYMKVTSNNGSTGYTWIIDHDECKDILDIESGYVYYEPESNDAFDIGYGEEIFTLTAKKYGTCTFRIAYARAWEWSNFADHISSNGYIIEVPIQVVNTNPSGGGSTGGGSSGGGRRPREDPNEYVCDPNVDNCDLKEQLMIGWKEERAFALLGISAWLRTIMGLNPVGHLPSAIFYLGAKKGNVPSLKKFMWTTKYWTHIFGWATSLAYCFIYYEMLGSWIVVIGLLMFIADIVGWSMYYLYRHRGYRYANYLLAVN